ncbi:MAG: hypothetical protein ABI306_04345 [Caulobacteraceae bacterium]
METFSISDAAFTGFRIARERPRAVAVWAGIQFAVSLFLGGLLIALAGRALMKLQALGAESAPSPAEVVVLFGRLAPAYGLILLFALAFNALFYAAMNRTVMAPADDRFGYFRFGADELRQLGLIGLAFALAVVAYIGLIVLAAAVSFFFALVARQATGFALALSALIAVGAAIFLATRLSLASAQTFATGRVNLFGSWALTRGRFWPILGTYVLAATFAAVVLVLGFVVTFAVVALIGGAAAMGQVMQPDLGSLAAFFSVPRLAQTALGAVVTALVWPVVGAPPAVIYQRLTAGPGRASP